MYNLRLHQLKCSNQLWMRIEFVCVCLFFVSWFFVAFARKDRDKKIEIISSPLFDFVLLFLAFDEKIHHPIGNWAHFIRKVYHRIFNDMKKDYSFCCTWMECFTCNCIQIAFCSFQIDRKKNSIGKWIISISISILTMQTHAFS